MSKQIQWFPGHMSKSLREFSEAKCDLYFLLLDSRAPESSFIDSFKEIIGQKKVILLLTKSDMVKKSDLEPWIKKYKESIEHVYSISFINPKIARKEVIKVLEGFKFKNLLPKLIILGVPNVGKSTLLNILLGAKKAIAEDRPGVTKKNDWYQFNKRFWILDTPGVLQPKFVNPKQGINLASIGSIKLDILPLDEVATCLVDRLINLGRIEHSNAELYVQERINDAKKQPTIVHKKIIKDFQQLKFGKVILD